MDPVLRRWLDCELGGFGVLTDIQPLHVVLATDPAHPIVDRVAAYRTQIGIVFAPEGPRSFAHFFVEPIGELESLARAAKDSTGTLLTVDSDRMRPWRATRVQPTSRPTSSTALCAGS